jgi:signal transduction histidine kinase
VKTEMDREFKSQEKDEVKLNFEVSDTGLGIKESNLSKLFKVFGTLKMKNGINQHGIGLGLTICKALAEKLGGNISVQSVKGIGTTFSFSIKTKVKDASHKPSHIRVMSKKI